MKHLLFCGLLLVVAMFMSACESEAPLLTNPEPDVFPELSVSFGISNAEDYVPFVATTIATISGGSADYHCEVYQDGELIDTLPVTIVRFEEVRTYQLSLKVVDIQTGKMVEKSVTVTGLAMPPGLPLESWFFASPISGQTPFDVSLLGGGRGGVAPYSYEIRRGDQLVSNQELANLTISEVGEHHFSFKVRDAAGDSASSYLDITAFSPDTALTLTANLLAFPAQAEVGKQIALISQAHGGVEPYHYEMFVGGQSIATDPMTLYTISDTGRAMVELRVRDDEDGVVYDTVWITGLAPYVYHPPTLSVDASAAPSRLSVGYPTTLDADVTGGVAPFRYEWGYNGQVFSNNESATFTTSQAGDYQLQVMVTDSIGQIDSATISVTFESQGGGEVATWQVTTDLKAGPSDKTDSATVNTGQESSWNRIWFYIKLDVQSSLRKTMTLEFVYANGSIRQWLIADVFADRPAYVLIDGGEALVEPVLKVRWYYPGGTTASSSPSDVTCDNWNRVLEISGSREIPANYQGISPISVKSSFKTALYSN